MAINFNYRKAKMKNLCIRESYETKNGSEKTSWNRIGIMFESNGKEYIKLYHIPNVLICVFEQKKKEETVEETDVFPEL